jgi:hypothetical protein
MTPKDGLVVVGAMNARDESATSSNRPREANKSDDDEEQDMVLRYGSLLSLLEAVDEKRKVQPQKVQVVLRWHKF